MKAKGFCDAHFGGMMIEDASNPCFAKGVLGRDSGKKENRTVVNYAS